MPTPYDGPERRAFDAAQRRMRLDIANATIRIAVSGADATIRDTIITALRAHFAGTDDAPIVERMIAAALGARVAPSTVKEP